MVQKEEIGLSICHRESTKLQIGDAVHLRVLVLPHPKPVVGLMQMEVSTYVKPSKQCSAAAVVVAAADVAAVVAAVVWCLVGVVSLLQLGFLPYLLLVLSASVSLPPSALLFLSFLLDSRGCFFRKLHVFCLMLFASLAFFKFSFSCGFSPQESGPRGAGSL